MPQHVRDEVQIRGLVDLRDDDGVEVFGVQDGVEVVEREARGDVVDADGELGDVGGSARGGEELLDVLAGGGFVGRGYAVFEVVAGCVDAEGVRFLEEFGGGRGDWMACVSSCLVF